MSTRLEVASRARRGDSLTLRLLVRNDTQSTITLPMTWEGDQAFDPIVRDAKGGIIWQRSAGQYRSAVGESRSIAPHEATTYRVTWKLRDSYGVPIPPGTYGITGRLIDGRDSVMLSAAEVFVVITS